MERPSFTKTTNVQLAKSLMDLLPSSASITHQYATACQALHIQREQMVTILERDWDTITHRESCREHLINYYNQISSPPISSLLIANSQVYLKANFEWRDGQGMTRPCKDKCGRLEWCNVVYNIGVASCCCAIEGFTRQRSSDRLPEAKKLFSEAAGAFNHCIELIREGGFLPEYNPAKVNLEMRVESLEAMSGCMTAYGMRCFYEKASQDGKSAGVLAKLASQCALTYDRSSELLKDAMAVCGKNHQKWLTGWRVYMDLESQYFQSQARIHSADCCQQGNEYAKELSHLKAAKSLLDTIYSASNSTSSKLGGGGLMVKKHRPALLQHVTSIQGRLLILQRDINAMVYGVQPELSAAQNPLPAPTTLSVDAKDFLEAFRKIQGPVLFGAVVFSGGRAQRGQAREISSSSSSSSETEQEDNDPVPHVLEEPAASLPKMSNPVEPRSNDPVEKSNPVEPPLVHPLPPAAPRPNLQLSGSSSASIRVQRSADVQVELEARGIVQNADRGDVVGRLSGQRSALGGKGGIVSDDEMGLDPAAVSQATREVAEAQRKRELSLIAAEKRAKEEEDEARRREDARIQEERKREEEQYMLARSRQRLERERGRDTDPGPEPPVAALSHATIQRHRDGNLLGRRETSGAGEGIREVDGRKEPKPGDVVAPGYLMGGQVEGIPYYVCLATNESVWELPNADHLAAVMVTQSRDSMATLKPGDSIAAGYVFGGYSQGLPFYVCQATGQSLWELPVSATTIPSDPVDGVHQSQRNQEAEDRLLAERLQDQLNLDVGHTAKTRTSMARGSKGGLDSPGGNAISERAQELMQEAQEERRKSGVSGGDQLEIAGERDERERKQKEREELLMKREEELRKREEKLLEEFQEREKIRNEKSQEEMKKQTQGMRSVPHEYVCPITMEIMIDPVIAMDGHTYERQAIENWLKRSQKSPKTNCLLPSKLLVPNHSLKSVILDWKDLKE